MEGSAASMDRRTERRPSEGMLAMAVSTMRLTWPIMGSGGPLTLQEFIFADVPIGVF